VQNLHRSKKILDVESNAQENRNKSSNTNRPQQSRNQRKPSPNYQQKTTPNVNATGFNNANRSRKPSADSPKIMDDFNFDEANARFNKEKLLEEVAASDKQSESNSDSEPAYNKDSSFFDNISCEATDRKDGKDKARSSMAEQRRLDAETFGQLSSDRGRGRMSRGRGRRYTNNNMSSAGPRQEQKVFRPVNQNADRGNRQNRSNLPNRGRDKTHNRESQYQEK